MTGLQRITMRCDRCDINFKAVVTTSIDAWMSPSLVEEFLNTGITKKCPKCQQDILVPGKILINGRKGGNWLDNSLNRESKLQKLIEWGAIRGSPSPRSDDT